ncbi:MAG: anhydro-N-acetylmuramic acid kinase [Acidobacteria bacterium]|nr:anhydro-N-acetylmuramic acid kinase [Acidobacteriota bacterium]
MSSRRRALRVLGLMSGTSADGIDVALVHISGAPPRLVAKLEHFVTMPFPAAVRAAVLRLANGDATTTAEISQLNFLLGEVFARAALEACRKFRVSPQKIDLIGSHGQTIYHQGAPSRFAVSVAPASSRRISFGAGGEEKRQQDAGAALRVASTLQIGEPAVIAERTGIPTVADFRPADMAAGGQGAPLVPFVDYLLYRDAHRGRVALNLGGIANVTVIPRAARPSDVFAFDTGPGNMVIDALVRHFSRGQHSFDRDARVARRGHLLPGLLNTLLADGYFRRPPPKTAGREQYGEAYTQKLVAWGRKHRARPADLVRTATLLTALSVVDAFHRWVLPRAGVQQLIVSGGGAHNPLLMAQLAAALPRIEILASGDLGVPEDAKEAFAFAILAYESFQGRPANLPGATGARHPAILGKITHAPRR